MGGASVVFRAAQKLDAATAAVGYRQLPAREVLELRQCCAALELIVLGHELFHAKQLPNDVQRLSQKGAVGKPHGPMPPGVG